VHTAPSAPTLELSLARVRRTRKIGEVRLAYICQEVVARVAQQLPRRIRWQSWAPASCASRIPRERRCPNRAEG
jgi:hypothetical protein